MNRYIILDCDGVLYPAPELSLKSMIQALKITAQQFSISNDRWKIISQKCKTEHRHGMINFMHSLCREFNIDFHKFTQAHTAYIDYNHISPNKELLQLLSKARNNGYQFIIASNNHLPHINKVLGYVLGDDNFIKNIQIFDGTSFKKNDTFIKKPSADYYSELLNKLQITNANDALYFDDDSKNVAQAKILGMNSFLISPQNELTAHLQKLL